MTAMLRLSDFDGPPVGAPDVTTLEMRVLRRVHVEGMDEVLLCELLDPLLIDGGRLATHAAVSPRLAGQTLTDAPFADRAANLAFVTATDPGSLKALGPQDVLRAAIGKAQAIPRPLAWHERLMRRLTGGSA